MKNIVEGAIRFQKEGFNAHRDLFERLAGGQSPGAMFITCSDSRIAPNLITGTDPGELFVLRNAGNIIPPFGDLLNEPEFVSHPAYDAFMAMAAGREATNYHIPPAQEILQIFGQAVLDVMFGKEAAKPAQDKAAVGMDEVLARY